MIPWARLGFAATLGLLAAGCATAPSEPAARAAFRATNDPLEPMNRRIFAANQILDRTIVRPVARAYVRALPPAARNCLRHFLDNLHEPLVMTNCLLQARFRGAGISASRFVINSTLGFGGLDDQAATWHLPPQVGDSGQTLWAWGFGEGPYLVIPVLGPSSPRDAAGLAGDIFLDPLRYVGPARHVPTSFSIARGVADGIDQRARNLDALDEIQRESIDYYAAFRSFYRQHRAGEVESGRPQPPPLPPADFYRDPGS